MSMNSSQAEQAVTVSALLVAGIYTYRRLAEGSGHPTGGKVAQLLGSGSPPSVGTFITAWGAAFLVISMMAAASPPLGGTFALLVAAGDLLNNLQQVSADINGKLTAGKTSKPVSANGGGGTIPAPRHGGMS